MSKVSKGTTDKLSFSRAVETAIEVHGKDVASAFEQWLFQGEVPRKMSAAEWLTQMRHRLAADAAVFEARDLAHRMELADDSEPRQRRDAASAELRSVMISVRDLIRGAFGPAHVKAVGLDEPDPRRDELLAAQARGVVKRLGEHAFGKPGPGAKNIDIAEMKRAIIKEVERLGVALADVKREEKEAQKSIVERDRAEADWARSYTAVGEMLVAFCRAAGEHEIADRVKPTARRRAGIVEEPVQPAEPSEPTASL